MWSLQNVQSFAVKREEGNAESSASFARTSPGWECFFFKEKSNFPLAYTQTNEGLAHEELLYGVCSTRPVLSPLRTCENPTPRSLCVVDWPAPTLSPSGVLEDGGFWKCIFLGICASQESLCVHRIIPSAFHWPGRGCRLVCGAYATLELLLLLQCNTCTGISWLLMTAGLGLTDFFGTEFLLLPSAAL